MILSFSPYFVYDLFGNLITLYSKRVILHERKLDTFLTNDKNKENKEAKKAWESMQFTLL